MRCGGIAEQLALRAMLCEYDLREIDVALAKSAFTPGEIEIPHTNKAFVEAQTLDRIEILEKALAPGGQSLCVMHAHTFDVRQSQLGCAGQRAGYCRDGRQFASGKNVGLNPVGALAVGADLLFGQ